MKLEEALRSPCACASVIEDGWPLDEYVEMAALIRDK
jgi:hypothetical protein